MKKKALKLLFLPFHCIFYLFSLSIIGVALLLVFILIFLGLPLRSLSKEYFYHWSHTIAGYWIVLMCFWINKFVRIHVTGKYPEKNKNAFAISNHQYMLDLLLIENIAIDCGIRGELQVFGKKAFGDIPIFGWCLRMLGFVLLKRSWAEDKENVMKALSEIKESTSKFWLILCPEGTRWSLKKLEKSNAIAQKKNLPLTKYTLLPRSRGFVEVVTHLKERLDCICDITIAYTKKPSLITYVLAGYIQEVHVDVRTYEKLDMDREETKDWLEKSFLRKEKLLKYFHENQSFPKETTSY